MVAGRWKRHPVEAIEFRGREQSQRIPALAPDIAHTRVCIQDHEVRAGARQVIADGKSSLPAANDDDVEYALRQLHRDRAFFDHLRGGVVSHDSLS
jgi:hypothetical protein